MMQRSMLSGFTKKNKKQKNQKSQNIILKMIRTGNESKAADVQIILWKPSKWLLNSGFLEATHEEMSSRLFAQHCTTVPSGSP